MSTLGNDTRLQILLELAAVANDEGMGSGLPFSALRDRVGVADSGRFNYHLDELTDQFVTKLDDEYVARYPGLAVVAALYAGEHRDPAEGSRRSVPTEFTCPDCSRQATATYGRESVYSGVWLECPEHGSFDTYPVPPGACHDRSLADLLDVAYMRAHTNIRLARHGVCLECWGSVTITYPAESDCASPDGNQVVRAEIDCQRCWNWLSLPLRSVLVTYPPVQAMFLRHGYRPAEAAEQVTGPDGVADCETTLHDDSHGATVRYELHGEEHVLTVDEACSVVEHRR
jgi:hypothetical protein